MGRALNYSGIPIPGFVPGLFTVKGADGRRYALRMQELKNWLQQQFGMPQIAQKKPVSRNTFNGSQGIIAFDITFGLNPDGITRALGHLDLWDGRSFTHQSVDPRDYFTLASKVGMWKSP